jgi:hypothetical protein
MDVNQIIDPSSKSLNLPEANAALLGILSSWGISHFCSATGGGLIKFLKYIETYQHDVHNLPSLLTASELVTDKAARYADMPELTTQFAEILQAPTIWTVN